MAYKRSGVRVPVAPPIKVSCIAGLFDWYNLFMTNSYEEMEARFEEVLRKNIALECQVSIGACALDRVFIVLETDHTASETSNLSAMISCEGSNCPQREGLFNLAFQSACREIASEFGFCYINPDSAS